MNAKTFFSISGVVFLVVAVMHAIRLWRGWEIMVGGWNAPTWASALAVAISGFLAYTAFRLRRT